MEGSRKEKPTLSTTSLTDLFRPNYTRQHPSRLSETRLDLLKQEIRTDVHLISLGELYTRFDTNPDGGLPTTRAYELLAFYGPNALTPPTKESWIPVLLTSLFNRFTILLWIAAILSFIAYNIWMAQDYYDPGMTSLYLACVLLVFIVLYGLVRFAYTYSFKTYKIMKLFNNMIPKHARCLRNGTVNTRTPTRDLVYGDIVHIYGGDVLPADIRIIKSKGFKVNNSALTGEFVPVSRENCAGTSTFLESPNIAFMASTCVEGWASGVVIHCGDLTALGRVAIMATRINPSPSPLRREIKRMMLVLGIITAAMATGAFILSLALGCSGVMCITFVIGAIVANVPAGLHVTLTAALKLTSRQMSKKNCLVKNKYAVETLGTCTTICSDKTGTLTQNKLCVRDAWMWNNFYNITDAKVILDLKESKTFIKLRQCASLCNSATFEKGVMMGSPSEVAILQYLIETFDPLTRRKNFPKRAEIPFNSTNKYQVSVHLNKAKNTHVVMMKGAPEVVVPRCSHFASDAGQYAITSAIKNKSRDAIAAATDELASNGETVFAFADLVLNSDQFPRDYIFNSKDVNFPLSDLRFLGLMGLMDPPRTEALDAVNRCRDAGVRVLMVTGDHPMTARAIAAEVGIATSSDVRVITGNQMRQMSPELLDRILEKDLEIVFARTSPTQKLQIVEALQRQGEVVAVTGDGINDAPALRKADVGIAMGLTGSKITKESADLILLDDNFATIVVGIEEGRKIFVNLKKCVCYILISNVPQIFALLMYLLCSIPLPLGILTMLCVDLSIEIWPAVGISTEPAERDVMARLPRQNERIMTSQMIFLAYFHLGLIEVAAGMFAYFVVMAEYGFYPNALFGIREAWDDEAVTDLKDSLGQRWNYVERKALERATQSTYLVAVALMQLTNAFVGRTRYNSLFRCAGLKNQYLNCSMCFALVVVVLMCYTPVVNEVLGTYPLKLRWWFLSLPFGVYMVTFDELRKFCIRRQLLDGWFNRLTYY